jgi:iron-sulfur cluster repair protein YtfE (RIC family)
MKRHPVLIPLSREHHDSLILARLLQKDAPAYKGLPTDPAGKAEYAFQFYHDELIGHFDEEEKILPYIKGINDELDLFIKIIPEEHEELTKYFMEIKDHSDLPSHLDKLGKALELHVRKEERQFFPLIQESCTDDQMDEIARALEISE